MPSTSINGCSIRYKVLGSGVPVVLSAGGRQSMEELFPLAENLSKRCRVILWDRANLGSSDVSFSGATDLDLWSDQLVALLDRLGISSAYLAAASAGARLSIRAHLRYPEVFSGMFLWLISGANGSEALAKWYYGDAAQLAEQGGMSAVAKEEFWAARIASNPANLQLLLAQNPVIFARTMRRWEKSMQGYSLMMGATEEELKSIRIPAAVVMGTDDKGHTRDTAERVVSLIPDAERLDPPGFREEWLAIKEKAPKGSWYERIPQLPSLISSYVERVETRSRTLAA